MQLRTQVFVYGCGETSDYFEKEDTWIWQMVREFLKINFHY